MGNFALVEVDGLFLERKTARVKRPARLAPRERRPAVSCQSWAAERPWRAAAVLRPMVRRMLVRRANRIPVPRRKTREERRKRCSSPRKKGHHQG
jgi:hypothetical protein